MSVPRPAICVEIVTRSRSPARATIAASSASLRALSTAHSTPRRAQGPGQPFGLGDVLRAQQHRLARGVDLRDVRDDRLLLLLDGAVDAVGQVLADARLVGVDRADRQLVELVQLLGDGDGRAGHPAQRAVAPEQGLHDDPVEHRAGGAGLEPLHRLDGRLQPVRPALQVRHAAAGVVDQLDLAVADEVVDVAVQQRVGVERDVDRREGVRLVFGVEVDAAETALDPGQPERGEVDGAARRVGLVVHVGAQPPHGGHDLGVDDARVDAARQHQRHPGGVDQHRVGLVDDGDVRLGHDRVVEVGDEPVAQHVEADLVDRHVHDVVRVGRPAVCLLARLA